MEVSSLPQRKSIRLKNYDYSQNGYYHITICTQGKRKLFWPDQPCEYDVGANCVRPPLSAFGNTVEGEIGRLSNVYKTVAVDKYVVMPNHVHIILVLDWSMGGRPQVALRRETAGDHRSPLRIRKTAPRFHGLSNNSRVRFPDKSGFPFGNVLTTTTLSTTRRIICGFGTTSTRTH